MNTDNLTNETEENINEEIPSMDDFKDQINNSFQKLKQGDILTGTVLGVSDTQVTLDLDIYAEGIIPINELSNDPSFSIQTDIAIGDKISAMLIKEDDGEGSILLSKKKADDVLAWDSLSELLESKEIVTVKISQAVNAGVITYLSGIRAFIPASQLSLSYVENLEEWVGKEIEAIAITVSKDENRLVLSGKEVERKKQLLDRDSKISSLQIGIVTKGKVESIMPYGAFVNIGDGISGLVHISQVSHKRVNSPGEVVKVGEEIKVKIIAIKDGKVSLSIKAIEDREKVVGNAANLQSSYSEGDVTTNLSSLLKDIKL